MAGFALNVAAWAEKQEGDANQWVRRVVFELGARLIYRSPVDTGRFRSNWYYSIDGSVGTTTPKADKQSNVNGLDGMPETAVGHVHFLQNNLPYARRLEYGWSKQAPAGMVGLTVLDFEGIASNSLADVRARVSAAGGGA